MRSTKTKGGKLPAALQSKIATNLQKISSSKAGQTYEDKKQIKHNKSAGKNFQNKSSMKQKVPKCTKSSTSTSQPTTITISFLGLIQPKKLSHQMASKNCGKITIITRRVW